MLKLGSYKLQIIFISHEYEESKFKDQEFTMFVHINYKNV